MKFSTFFLYLLVIGLAVSIIYVYFVYAKEVSETQFTSLTTKFRNIQDIPAAIPVENLKVIWLNQNEVKISGKDLSIDLAIPDVFTNYASMSPTFRAGKIISTSNFTKSDIKVGDIVIFTSPRESSSGSRSWMHRIVAKNSTCYTTQGDYNLELDPFCVHSDNITKKVVGIIYGMD